MSLQAQHSLLSREIEREHVPLCLSEGVGIIAWGALAAGMLTGKVRRDTAPPVGSRLASDPRHTERARAEDNLAVVDVVVDVAAEIECTPSQVALAWVAERPAVSSVILGARTAAQIDDNLGAASVTLTTAQAERLDQATALAYCYPYDYLPICIPSSRRSADSDQWRNTCRPSSVDAKSLVLKEAQQ